MSDVVNIGKCPNNRGCGWRCSYGYFTSLICSELFAIHIHIYTPFYLAASTLIILFSEILRFSKENLK
jgi:hypothetical protein